MSGELTREAVKEHLSDLYKFLMAEGKSTREIAESITAHIFKGYLEQDEKIKILENQIYHMQKAASKCRCDQWSERMWGDW